MYRLFDVVILAPCFEECYSFLRNFLNSRWHFKNELQKPARLCFDLCILICGSSRLLQREVHLTETCRGLAVIEWWSMKQLLMFFINMHLVLQLASESWNSGDVSSLRFHVTFHRVLFYINLQYITNRLCKRVQYNSVFNSYDALLGLWCSHGADRVLKLKWT